MSRYARGPLLSHVGRTKRAAHGILVDFAAAGQRTWKRSRTRRGPCSSSRENSSVDRTSASFMISPRPLMMLRSS